MPDGGSAITRSTFSQLPNYGNVAFFLCRRKQVSDMKTNQLNYSYPPISVLDRHDVMVQRVLPAEIEEVRHRILKTLAVHDVRVESSALSIGPGVSLLKVKLEPGQGIRSIISLQDDIAYDCGLEGMRFIPLQDCLGIEFANPVRSIVPLRSLLESSAFQESKAELPVAIGYGTDQTAKVIDLDDAPHILMAGATKQGKSMAVHTLIASLLRRKSPDELRFVLIDPKMVELSAYSNLLYHFLAVIPGSASGQEELENSIAKSPKQAEAVLKSLCVEMDERYTLLGNAMVNNIKLYNSKWKDRHLPPTEGHHFMPYIVVVVDEYADLTMSAGTSRDSRALARSISSSIIRLAQKGRAAGIHVVLATQRPSVDVITGLIKSNFPARMAFRVSSKCDSKAIIDKDGAERLTGEGDMLFQQGGVTERIQGGFISNDDIIRLTSFIVGQRGFTSPYYLPASEDLTASDGTDRHLEDAARLVVSLQIASTGHLARRLGIGYAKAGSLMDRLESLGIVGPLTPSSKIRKVLVKSIEELEFLLSP